MRTATLVATLTAPPTPGGDELSTLPACVEWLEVRADLCGGGGSGDVPAALLRQHFRGRLLYALRSHAEGGAFSDAPGERKTRLLEAAKRFDLVELEGARDLSDELLAAIPPSQRLISWHGATDDDVPALGERFAQLSRVPALLYKLVPRAARSGDECAPLALLNALGRTDVIAFASGATGFWSRFIAPRLGAPFVFGALPETDRREAGEPTINQLIADYGLPSLPPLTELYGIVGNPVAHSLSPRLHNAAYRAFAHPALFVPFHVASFADFWREVVSPRSALAALGISVRGLTIASPHKEEALKFIERTPPMVARAGATNICTRRGAEWVADTTDPHGIMQTTRERGIEFQHRRVAVIGCGGAGRAIAAALDEAGAEVTLVNRGHERAAHAVALLKLPFVPLEEFNAAGYSVVVNATPVGRDDHGQPFEAADLREDAAVIDLVYGAEPTPLITRSRALGHVAIDGREVLLAQALRQFQLMTGREMPLPLARETLGYEVANFELSVMSTG